MTASTDNQMQLTQALDTCWDTIKRTIPKMGTDRPSIGRSDLTYQRCGDSEWVDGFWSGQLWLAYAETHDPSFFQAARAQRPYFIDRLDRPDSHSHDLGFLYTLSLVADYKLTGDTTARAGALRAAEALMKRYNEQGRFIQAWNSRNGVDNEGRIIIDCMENLALLFWAAQESGSARYAEIATAHAETTARFMIRPDGSSYHTYFFDPDSGQPIKGNTHQGYADESCWSRGQAWGIHGFAQVYHYTNQDLFLESARKLADYAIANLPNDYLPFWDYRLPTDVPHYRDTSAAAITTAGLLTLADQIDNTTEAARYRDTARNILISLVDHYTTKDLPHSEGLLVQGAAHVNQGFSNTMLPYGDYFFVESLLRALGRTHFAW